MTIIIYCFGQIFQILCMRILLIFALVLIVTPLFGQKGKKKDKVPNLHINYTRFSLFAFQDGSYVHKQTTDVWAETVLDVKSKTRTVSLPGLGTPQHCTYSDEDCEFIEGENGLMAINIPIDCTALAGETERKYLRIYYAHNGPKIDYLFSLRLEGANDLILFHNYSDQDLGKLLAKNQIRFE